MTLLAGCGDDARPPAGRPPTNPTPPTNPERSPLDRLVAALGTSSALGGLQTFSSKATGSSSSYDEGPEADGAPVGSSDFTSTSDIDVVGGRWRIAYERTYKLIRPGTMAKYAEVIVDKVGTLVGDERVTGQGTMNFVGKMSSARLASTKRHQAFLNPHLLVKRLAASDVSDGGVSGSQRKLTVKDPDKISDLTLVLDEASGRLVSLALKESDPLRGDVELRFVYEGWEPAGELFFPRTVTVELGGSAVRTEERSAFAVNPPLDDALFAFPSMENAPYDEKEATRGLQNAMSYQRYASMGVGASQDFPKATVKGVEIGMGTGIYHLVGASHHTLLVDQGKTVVLVDAPNDATRSKALLDWIDKTLPGGLAENAVSHVILTHHHVDHTAGLRTFVARGAVPVVGEKALGLWDKVLAATRTIDPDELTAKPTKPAPVAVKAGDKFTLGNVSAYSITSSHANDMLVIHVAGAAGSPAILFVTDIYLPGLGGILPKSNFVKWSSELDTALVANNLNEDTTLILGGHGNSDAMGNHVIPTYANFKTQLAAALAATP